MTISFDWVKPGKNYAKAGADVAVAKKHSSGKNGGFNFSLILPEKMMRDARMVVGDRAKVGFGLDAEKGRCIAVARVVNGGYRVGANTTPPGGAETVVGKFVKSRIQCTWQENMFGDFTTENGGHYIDDDGVLIIWEGEK